ncbi:MAG: NUDIX domain-containing protein [Actinomycetota bacterium]
MASLGVFAAIFDDEGRILCVHRAYLPFNWTLPGGRVEPGESPIAALAREVHEETGLIVEPGDLIGMDAAPFKDDLVLFFRCGFVSRGPWSANGEIAEVSFRAADDLPASLSRRSAARVADAFEGRRGVFRVFANEVEGVLP